MIIAVDFDGTIVTHKYPEIGEEIPFAIDVLKLLQKEEHHRLILWTVRRGRRLEEALKFCRERGLEFYAANKNYPEEDEQDAPRKLNADMFIDDRNFGGLPDWTTIYRSIKGELIENNGYLAENNWNFRRDKNLILRFGEWLDRLAREIKKRNDAEQLP